MSSFVVLLLLAGIAGVLIWWFLLRNSSPPPCPAGSSTAVSSSGLALLAYEAYGIFVLTADGPTTSFASKLQEMINNNYGAGTKGQFVDRHYAFLVGGDAQVPPDGIIPVGFYTQVMGVCKDRSKVRLKTVCLGNGGSALDTFWRAAENYTWVGMTPPEQLRYGNYGSKTEESVFGPCTWAVSQACPLRGCIVAQDLYYATECFPPRSNPQACYASGGYSADNDFSGCEVNFGSQQQWCSVNDTYQKSDPTKRSTPTWNGVFVDCQNSRPVAPGTDVEVLTDSRGLPTGLLSDISLTSTYNILRRSKPFVVLKDDSKTMAMIVPDKILDPSKPVDEAEKDFFLVKDECSLLDALRKGSGVSILIAHEKAIPISKEVVIDSDSVILLGLGLPVLRILKGGSVTVSGEKCVVAGIIFEAGDTLATDEKNSSFLLRWTGKNGWMYDLFTRVGGSVAAPNCSCDVHVMIGDGASVIAENLWLWRADHDDNGGNSACDKDKTGGTNANKSYYGLLVEKDASLTCIGLASEHNLMENVSWSGSGHVFFYQSELVYCPPAQFQSAGFTINAGVTTFVGRGMGVYSYFPASECTVPSGIKDNGRESDIDGCITVFLNGQGGIGSVIAKPVGGGGCPVCKPPNSGAMVSVWTKRGAPSCPTIPQCGRIGCQ